MNFIPVSDKRTIREFLDLPTRLYKDDPHYIQPWDKDIEAVFDKKKNKTFRHGEADRWILQNDQGKTIGRIAVFINKKEMNRVGQPTGGFGFMDCVDDQAVAFALFDHAKAWLEERGMEAMDGPINFGEKHQWWGLLVKGHSEPLYGFNYHPPYYQKFYEAYGFKTFFEQYTFNREVYDDMNPEYEARARRVYDNPEYTFPKFKKKEIESVWAEAFLKIYNDAWKTHAGFQPMRKAQAVNLFKQMKPIVDEDTIIFAYHNGEPVGFFFCLPDINQLIENLNGKFNLLAKLKFLYNQKRGKCRKMFGMLYGVVPAYQRKSVEAAMVLHLKETIVHKNRYDEIELGWLGDFNPTMLKIAELVYCKLFKTYITYRKLFDENKPFERYPIIGKKKEMG